MRHIPSVIIVLMLLGAVISWSEDVRPFIHLRARGWVGLATTVRGVPHYHAVKPESSTASVVTLGLAARDRDDPLDMLWCVSGPESAGQVEEAGHRLMELDEASCGGSFWLAGEGWALLWVGGVDRAAEVRAALEGFAGPAPPTASLGAPAARFCLEAAARLEFGSLPHDHPLLIPLHLLRRLSGPVLVLMRAAALLTPGGAVGAQAGPVIVGGLLALLAATIGRRKTRARIAS